MKTIIIKMVFKTRTKTIIITAIYYIEENNDRYINKITMKHTLMIIMSTY